MFVDPIIITGDSARADIDIIANVDVAKVA